MWVEIKAFLEVGWSLTEMQNEGNIPNSAAAGQEHRASTWSPHC